MTTKAPFQTKLIRPGLLVSLATTIRGGVSYRKRTIEPEKTINNGKTSLATWETTRTVQDVEEYARAVVARGKARSTVVRECYATSFGLLCPQDKESDLYAAIDLARKIAQEHNESAQSTRIDVYVIVGRVADTDNEAASALAAETRDLIDRMEQAVLAANPEEIREAANKARAVAGMLNETAQARVNSAVEQARKAARDIVRRVEKAGETASVVIDSIKLDALTGARFAMMDLLGDTEEIDIVPMPVSGTAVDLDPSTSEPEARNESVVTSDELLEPMQDVAPTSQPKAVEIDFAEEQS